MAESRLSEALERHRRYHQAIRDEADRLAAERAAEDRRSLDANPPTPERTDRP